jgi:hypothetical protein
MDLLTAESLTRILDELQAASAAVRHEHDDYGNPIVNIQGLQQVPALSRHSVIGGEELVAVTAAGDFFKIPTPNGDPFGPIDDASTQITELWQQVVAAFPKAKI